MVSTSTLSGIFDEKVGGPFLEFLCLMEVFKIRFWGLFLEINGSHFPKIFLTFWIFSLKLGQRKQWNFFQIFSPFPEFLWKIAIPFSGFSIENMTLKCGIPHVLLIWKSSPPPPWIEPLSKQWVILCCKIVIFHQIWYSTKSSYSTKSQYSTRPGIP